MIKLDYIKLIILALLLLAVAILYKQNKQLQHALLPMQYKLASHDSLLQAEMLLLEGNHQQALEIFIALSKNDLIGKAASQKVNQIQLLLTNIANTKFSIKKSNEKVKSSKSKEIIKQANLINKLLEVVEEKERNNDTLLARLNLMYSELQQLDSLQKLLNETNYLNFFTDKGLKLIYLGTVKDGMANGNGMALWETGSMYNGGWLNNKRNGHGSFIWQDGETYNGDYKNDKREGNGTYVFVNGEKYVGEWHNDMRHGFGVLYDSKGEITFKGTWQNDKPKKSKK